MNFIDDLFRPKKKEKKRKSRRQRNIDIGYSGREINGEHYFYKTSTPTKMEAQNVCRSLRGEGMKCKILGHSNDWMVFYRYDSVTSKRKSVSEKQPKVSRRMGRISPRMPKLR